MTLPPPLPAFNPYAAPTARVEDAAVFQLELAERLTRLGAAILDWLVFLVPVILVAVLAAVMMAAVGKINSGSNFALAGMVSVAALAILALWIVNMVLLHRHGQTLGKRWLGIKVVLVDGSRCGLTRYVFARWLPVALLSAIPLIGWVFGLLDPLLIFGNDRRCLHDLIAGTIVVKA
ncbi:MAG: RDD family protein [Lysobacterales bacterium]